MKKHHYSRSFYKILLLALLYVLYLNIDDPKRDSDTPAEPNTTERLKVIQVIDVDTLIVSHDGRRKTLRLALIDAPETSQNKKVAHDAARLAKSVSWLLQKGKASKAHLEELLQDQEILLVRGKLQHDRFGRLLASPRLEDGRSLSLLMVQAGYAEPFYKARRSAEKEEILRAYKTARKEGHGIWSNEK